VRRLWEKLAPEERANVTTAIFSGFTRFQRGADEVSVNGVNLTREQLEALQELMSRHDDHRKDGGWTIVSVGELARMRARVAELEAFWKTLRDVTGCSRWDDPVDVIDEVTKALGGRYEGQDDE
jgi:hypothetical protein